MAHIHSVYDSDTHFSIDPITRKMKNESSAKTNLIQYDKNSERFTFDLPREIEGHDMAECNLVQVHYINIDSKTKEQNEDVYTVDDFQISPADEDVVICSWLISGNATRFVGPLVFLIRFACIDETGAVQYAWHTATYTAFSISEGMNNGEAIVQEYPDVLAQFEARIAKLEKNGGGGGGGTVIDPESVNQAQEAARAAAEYAENAEKSAEDAGESASQAASSAETADSSASAAQTAKEGAETAKNEAAQQATNAGNAAQEAISAATGAAEAKAAAEKAASDALAQKEAAVNARQAAETAKSGSEQAATNASAAAGTAGESATAAQNAAQSAVSAKEAAETAKTAAEGARDEAGQQATTAANAAQTAATAAENAGKAQTAAETAKSGAESARNEVNQSANNAAGSASAAATSATNASASAQAAQAAQTAAESAKSTAAQKATDATNAAQTATSKATEAANAAKRAEDAASVVGSSATVEIVLPSSDVAVVGKEYNLYHSAFIYSNLPADALDIAVTVSGGGTGYNYHECFRMTPTTAGEYTLTVYVRDKLCNATIAQKTMTLYVVENTLETVNNILILGDSYTDAGYYPAELQHNLSGGKIVSLGTVTDTVTIDNKSLTVTHEGHSGWATWDFAGNYEDSLSKFNSSANKFRNPTTNKFDLGYYLDTYHDGASITAIMLNLGENGVGANPTNIDGFVELVARIREYNETLPILIHMTIPQSPQDTKKTGGKYTSNHMARLWRDLMARLMDEFEGVANVHLVPVHAVIDMEHDLPTETVPICARNTTTIVRPCDGHPSKIGYLKMADVYYAHLLKYMGEGEPIPEEPDEPAVTNLLDFTVATSYPVTTATPKNEFAVGYKISASNLSADGQAYTTNAFAVAKGQKIKVEGIKLINTGYTNYFRWWFFNADGSRPYGSYVNFCSAEGVGADSVVVDSANNCAIVDTSYLSATFANITHARFSFVPSGEYTDVVATVVE